MKLVALFLLSAPIILLLSTASEAATAARPPLGPGPITEGLNCNGTKALNSTPFVSDVRRAIELLESKTPTAKNFTQEVQIAKHATKVYASATCLGQSMTTDICRKCLRKLGVDLRNFCRAALGGGGNRPLQGCSIVYKTYKFF